MGRVLAGVMAVGKHLGYDVGTVKGKRLIVHVHMGLYGDFTEGVGKFAGGSAGRCGCGSGTFLKKLGRSGWNCGGPRIARFGMRRNGRACWRGWGRTP